MPESVLSEPPPTPIEPLSGVVGALVAHIRNIIACDEEQKATAAFLQTCGLPDGGVEPLTNDCFNFEELF